MYTYVPPVLIEQKATEGCRHLAKPKITYLYFLDTHVQHGYYFLNFLFFFEQRLGEWIP